MTDIKNFTITFNKIARSGSEEAIFNDYLDMVICALSAGRYEKEYLSIVKTYSSEDMELFCELMAQMLIAMDNNGTGLADCLGEFYQVNLSQGHHGQFFTPEHICDAMAAMTINNEDRNKTILDPCCGSGRMLLSAAKVNRNNFFYGADLDSRCARMTAINLCLNGLVGEVAHMNSLSGEHWGGYSIERTTAYPRIPIIRKLLPKEGRICNSGPFNRAKEPSNHKSEQRIITVTQTKLNLE